MLLNGITKKNIKKLESGYFKNETPAFKWVLQFFEMPAFTKEKIHLVTPTTIGKLVQERAYLENLPGYCEVPFSTGQRKKILWEVKNIGLFS
jgi:hypothetical protein